MPIVSDAYANEVLDACYGDGRAAGMPATVYLTLFNGDPTGSGVELTIGTGGYARVAVANTTANWPDASGRIKQNGVTIAFPLSTGAWSHQPTHWAIADASTGGNLMDSGKLAPGSLPTVNQSGVEVTLNAGAVKIKT